MNDGNAGNVAGLSVGDSGVTRDERQRMQCDWVSGVSDFRESLYFRDCTSDQEAGLETVPEVTNPSFIKLDM